MIISHRYRFIFVKTYKTAGTSLEVYLSQLCGADDVVTPIEPPVERHKARNHRGVFCPLPELMANRGRSREMARAGVAAAKDLVRRRRFYNHVPAYKVQARIAPEIWSAYTKFCIERNPWDKTLSDFHMWRHRRGGQLTLDEHLARGTACVNAPLYTEPRAPRRSIVDRVLRYEGLTDQLGALLAELGLPFDGSLGVEAKGGYRKDRRPYQEVFSEAQRRRVEEIFAVEIAMHGYRF